MDAKSSRHKLEEKRIFFHFKLSISPLRYFINPKGENSSIMRIADIILIKRSSLNKTYQYHVPFDMIHLQGYITSVAFLPKMHTLRLIKKKKDETNANYRAFYKITSHWYSKHHNHERQKD